MKRPAISSINNIRLIMQSPTNLVAITFIVQNGFKLLSTIVLTRLLVPEAYAIIGIVTSLSFVIAMLTDVGFQAFMLRHERLSERRFRDTMWTIRLFRSCILAALLFIFSGPIATWVEKPNAAYAIQLFSLTFVFDGLIPISIITALADNRIKSYCFVDIALSILNIASCVCIAILDGGVFSLVYAAIVTSIFRVGLFRVFIPDSFLVFSFEMETISEVLKFGRYIVASSIITLFIMQIDKIGLARILESDRLGAYFLATNIAMVPRGLANSLASKSLYPAYSRVFRTSNEFDSSIMYKNRRALDPIFALACLIGVVLSPFVVSILYDARYSEVSDFLAIMFFGLAPLMWNLSINEFLVAGGLVSTTFKANVVRLLWISTVSLPFLWNGDVRMFMIGMAGTEYFAYLFLLNSLRRSGFIRYRGEFLPITICFFSLCLLLMVYFERFQF